MADATESHLYDPLIRDQSRDLYDPWVRIRARTSERLRNDILAEIKPADKDLRPESNNPYTMGNVLWLTSALVVFRLAEVPETFLYDPRKNNIYFFIGVLCILVNVSICIFCVVWLSFIKKVESNDWEKLYPSAIPIATGSFAVGGVCVTIGLWPIWGCLTPVILFVLFMGFIVFVAMIPNWGASPSTGTTVHEWDNDRND